MKTDLKWAFDIIDSTISNCKVERENHLENYTSYDYYNGAVEALEYTKVHLLQFIKDANNLMEKSK